MRVHGLEILRSKDTVNALVVTDAVALQVFENIRNVHASRTFLASEIEFDISVRLQVSEVAILNEELFRAN